MKLNRIIALLSMCFFVFACQKSTLETPENPVETESEPQTALSISTRAVIPTYATNAQAKITKNGTAVQLIGANGFHTFGVGSADMTAWKLDIVREFVGNMKEQPISGAAIQSSTGAWLHSLQAVVDNNRANGKVTILCPFGWDGTQNTLFTGKFPPTTAWWTSYQTKIKAWATQFKSQPDVWLEVWNEPYRYDRADGYTDALWVSHMNTMVSLIRNQGNTNIIVVPCAEQGQDEKVLINQGTNFLKNKSNIVFDIHAYEKWLLSTQANITSRLDALKSIKLPIIIGELGPMNAGTLMNTAPFLTVAQAKGFHITAWVWKYDANDKDALLDAQGNPNNNNNNNYGSTFKATAALSRVP